MGGRLTVGVEVIRCLLRRAHAERDEGALVAELAILTPILIIAIVMAVNGLTFVSECARFDRVAAETARYTASSGESPGAVLGEALGYSGGSFAVTAERRTRLDLGVFSYQEVACTLTYSPWPLGAVLFNGTPFAWKVPGSLTHEQSFVVDQHKNGILF